MLKLTLESTATAIKRAHERKCRVRYTLDNEYAVRCAHNHDHIVRFEERADGLYSECFLLNTGEECPAALGRRCCYHQAAALALYQVITERRTVRKADRGAPHKHIAPWLSMRERIARANRILGLAA